MSVGIPVWQSGRQYFLSSSFGIYPAHLRDLCSLASSSHYAILHLCSQKGTEKLLTISRGELMGRETRFQEADDNLRLLREGSVLGLQLYKSVVQKGHKHKLEKKGLGLCSPSAFTLARMGAH